MSCLCVSVSIAQTFVHPRTSNHNVKGNMRGLIEGGWNVIYEPALRLTSSTCQVLETLLPCSTTSPVLPRSALCPQGALQRTAFLWTVGHSKPFSNLWDLIKFNQASNFYSPVEQLKYDCWGNFAAEPCFHLVSMQPIVMTGCKSRLFIL